MVVSAGVGRVAALDAVAEGAVVAHRVGGAGLLDGAAVGAPARHLPRLIAERACAASEHDHPDHDEAGVHGMKGLRFPWSF